MSRKPLMIHLYMDVQSYNLAKSKKKQIESNLGDH